MAARVGEAGTAYPPDPSNALPSTPAMVSQVRCNCMGGSWETDGDGAILCSPQAVTLLVSHQMLQKQPSRKESNNSQSSLALGQQCVSTAGKPSSGAAVRWGSLWQVSPN